MIDAHVHLWDPALGYSWLARAPEVYRRSYTLDDYILSPGAADRIVLVEANDDSTAEDARHVALGRDRRIAAVVTRAPRTDAAGVRGGRITGRESPVPLPPPDGVLEVLVDRAALAEVDDLADRTTGPVVLDHFGDPPAPGDGGAAVRGWRSAVSRLARHPRVHVKFSAALALHEVLGDAALRDAAAHLLDCFGPERVLVGSDWPICLRAGSLADSLGLALELAGGGGGADEVARRVYRVA